MIWELLCALAGFGFLYYAYNCEFGERIRKLKKLPGPSGYPLIGNALDIIDTSERLFQLIRQLKSYGNVVRLWSLHIRVAMIYHPDGAEKILSTTKFNEKQTPYNFIRPWLCEGLLLSNGEKWQHRRKMLTPAFHFDVLNQFMKTFVEQANSMVAKMQHEVGKDRTDPAHFVTETTLNVICETALGTRIHKGVEKQVKDYLKAIHVFGETFVHRVSRVYYHFEWAYYFTSSRINRDAAITKLHKFSEDVIQKRRIYRKKFGFDNIQSNGDEVYGKKRMAMLDLLLKNENEGKIDHSGIREEVDTFMLGHDTTATAVSLFLMLIGNEEEAQKNMILEPNLYEEMQNIFGEDDRDPTAADLNAMPYLECCIKESLRLYPSIPLIVRLNAEDVEIDGYIIPAGTICDINVYDIHRRPDLYPEPERFIPERFLPENTINRHSYAYIPFSAGPRNCIGKKFAMLEMKTLLSGILRKFKILPVTRPEDIIFCVDIVLRSKNPFYIRVENRATTSK